MGQKSDDIDSPDRSDDMRFPDFSLNGKIALVTGAGKGIGRAISLAMAKAGSYLVVTSRTESDLISLVEEIEGMGRKAKFIIADLQDTKQVKELAEKALGAFGRIDILVNNAGVSFPEPALETSEENWDKTFNTNIKGLFFLSQAIGRYMVERKAGKVVNISSQAGVIGLENHAAYCASKGAVILLTKVLAMEWGPYNINVNAVAPTVIKSPMTDIVFADPEVRAGMMRRIPLGRFGDPEDVAGAVVFLSSSAADMITGETLLVDGGWTAQ